MAEQHLGLKGKIAAKTLADEEETPVYLGDKLINKHKEKFKQKNEKKQMIKVKATSDSVSRHRKVQHVIANDPK